MASGPKHIVVLRSYLKASDIEVLAAYLQTIETESGVRYPYLLCSKIDAAHFMYLEMTVCLPRSNDETHLMLPHQFVFQISEIVNDKLPIGFLRGDPL